LFNGFSSAASEFLWGVRFNNYRSWFMEHKQEYLTLVQQPLKELAHEVYEGFTEAYPELDMELHVSRIYRDARRLHGKGPYKDHLWFSIRKPTATHWTERPVFWFEIRPEGYGYGMGMWMAKPFTMECYRKEILEHPNGCCRWQRLWMRRKCLCWILPSTSAQRREHPMGFWHSGITARAFPSVANGIGTVFWKAES